MAQRLRSTYPGTGSVISISNAALMLSGETAQPTARRSLGTLGFLSNLSAEKGVHEFLDVCAAIQKLGLPIGAKLAGPFQDRSVEQAVRQRLEGLPSVTYVGSVYADEKANFYASVDALLFPTRYQNEAEPLTVHEALKESLPVIAFGRGAIPEILTRQCGKIVPPDGDFTGPAMAQIVEWLEAPEALHAASLAASARFATLYADNVRQWQDLKVRMLDDQASLVVAGSRP
jgi:glycosyltransferase involved in cell wall biosynthesis